MLFFELALQAFMQVKFLLNAVLAFIDIFNTRCYEHVSCGKKNAVSHEIATTGHYTLLLTAQGWPG